MNSKQRRRKWREYEDKIAVLEFRYRLLFKSAPTRPSFSCPTVYIRTLKFCLSENYSAKELFYPAVHSSLQHRQGKSWFPFHQAPLFNLARSVATVRASSNVCGEQISRQVLDDAIDALSHSLSDSAVPFVRGSTFVAQSTDLTSKADHDRPKSS